MSRTGNNGNGRQRERLSDHIDRAVALQDQELGLALGMRHSKAESRRATAADRRSPGGPLSSRDLLISASPDFSVPPPTPPRGPHRATDATLGISGTPIVSGFLEDLGEYNGELAGRNALPIYEKMRRGDGQVRATLAACKLPIQSARWEVIP